MFDGGHAKDGTRTRRTKAMGDRREDVGGKNRPHFFELAGRRQKESGAGPLVFHEGTFWKRMMVARGL